MTIDYLVNLFGLLDGGKIAGGCDDCAAYQTIDAVERGVWLLVVHHDDTCPTWRRIQQRSRQS